MGTSVVEIIPDKHFILSLTCKDEAKEEQHGTGVLFRTDDPVYDIVITAGHCLVGNSVQLMGFDGLDIVHIYRPKDYQKESPTDFGAIIIRKVEDTAIDIPKLVPTTEVPIDTIQCLQGYPYMKRVTPDPVLYCDVKYSKTIDDGRLKYMLTLDDSMDYSKKELLCGVSGGAIYQESEGLSVFAIAVNTGLSDGAYDELYAISINNIIQSLRNEDIIYFHEGDSFKPHILHESIEPLNLIKAEEQISAILIGKSGAGKSAFAKTFLKHGSMLAATGETQTTRSTIEYQIGLTCKAPSVKVQFMNKEEFVNLQIKRCRELLSENKQFKLKKDKPEQDAHGFPSLSDFDITVGQLCEQLLENRAFFHYEELKHLSKDLLNDIDNVFYGIFGKDIDNNLPDEWSRDEYIHTSDEFGQKDPDKISKEDGRGLTYNANDMVELFLQIIHGRIMTILRKKYHISDTVFSKEVAIDSALSDVDREFINYSLKVCDGRLSLTALVKTVIVKDRVSDDYRSCFIDNGLKQLLLIDTYGLDHEKMAATESIRERVFDLSKDHADIDFVFYIRKLLTDSPVDIQTIIPLIYKAKPGIRVYTIFTCIDDNAYIKGKHKEQKVLDLDELKIHLSAIKYFQTEESRIRTNASHNIVTTLQANDVSAALAQSIYENMRDHIVPYCASEVESDYSKYRLNNIYHINKLLRTIVQKEFLGSGIINIRHLEKSFEVRSQPEVVRSKLTAMLGKMFQSAKITWTFGMRGTGHWRTQLANINKLQKNVLGYQGTHRHTWDYIFNIAYNDIFSVLSEDDFTTFFSTDSALNDAVAIRQFINEFGGVFLGCKRDGHLSWVDGSICQNCSSKDDCFRATLMSCYGEEELKEPISSNTCRVDWLNQRTNFDKRFDDNKDLFIDLFVRTFIGYVVPRCKKHNTRIIAKSDGICHAFLKAKELVISELEEREDITIDRIIDVFKAVNN